jgi:catechol 2,3-dioxygenase-like lactoylglutathione lyase family enzyme
MTAPAAEKVSNLIPFVHVTDVQRSIDFYGLLGFELQDTHHHEDRLDWASLSNARAQIMLAHASAPVDPRQQAVLFYLYVDDLDALRERLLAHQVAVGHIRDGSPGPEREIGLRDPDGYCLMIAESDSAD